MNKNYFEFIANIAELNTYNYKILLLLLSKPYTQAELARTLDIQPQNTNKYIKELESFGLVDIDRIEGRNKFYKAVTNTNLLKANIKGQINIFD